MEEEGGGEEQEGDKHNLSLFTRVSLNYQYYYYDY